MSAISSYLDGLVPFGNDARELGTMKDGTPYYDGSPHQFEDWRSKVEASVQGASLEKEEDRDKCLSKVALRVFQGLQDSEGFEVSQGRLELEGARSSAV